MLQRGVLNLFHSVQVDRVIIGAKFLSFEEVDSCLIELQNDDLVEQAEALDLSLVFLHGVCQLCNLVHFAFF